jgi:hypothetical protein
MEMRDPGQMPIGLEHMRRMVADQQALVGRLAAMERWQARLEGMEAGALGEVQASDGAGRSAWEPQSGKRLAGGLSETVGDYAASILTGNRTATLETITVDGQSSAAKVRLKLQFPILSWSVVGPCYIEIWDGTPGSGTLLYQGLYTMETAGGYVPWYTEIDVAAFTGSKTFNVTIQNVIGSTATITVFGAGGSRPRRFEAVWQT